MIFDKLRPIYFLLAFAVGLVICYVLEPRKKVVLKFPSPTNAGKVTYVDKQGQCYKYNVEKLDACPNNATVKPQPVMEDFRNINKI
jgi:hypothetical protein